MLHERPMSYLYEVGIQGGIRRAADMLGINPSVISRQIAQLERALELPLLERQGRNVVLTEAGRLLAEDYFESRQRREKLESHLKDLRHMRGGTISVRIGGGLVTTFIESVMSTFAQSGLTYSWILLSAACRRCSTISPAAKQIWRSPLAPSATRA